MTFRPLTEAEIAERRGQPSKADVAAIDKAADELGRNVMYIPPEMRRRLATDLMIAPPSTSDLAEFQKFMEQHRMIQGLPADVLVRLQVLEDLADKGNSVAAWVFTRECQNLGITFPKRF